MEKIIDLYDLYWHDSILKSIHIDRQQAGENDIISLQVKWWDSNEENEVVFQNVWWANLNLNFGFQGPETIYEASILPDNDIDLERVKKIIGQSSTNKKLRCYYIKTNSDIKIIAEGFVLK